MVAASTDPVRLTCSILAGNVSSVVLTRELRAFKTDPKDGKNTKT